MGREIRRVPKNWEHPKDEEGYYLPMYEMDFDKEEMVCFQVYETSSAGTPTTPVFQTKDELIEYLIEYGEFGSDHGYTKEQAQTFVNEGWIPSGVIHNGKFYFGIEAMDVLNE